MMAVAPSSPSVTSTPHAHDVTGEYVGFFRKGPMSAFAAGVGEAQADMGENRRKSAARVPRFQLIGGRADAVRWRLLGTNNVSLGLSFIDYASSEECVAAIRWLCVNVGRTRLELKHDNGVRWRWLLYAGAEAVAKAGHAYGRRIEAKRAHERFVAGVTTVVTLSGEGRGIEDRASR
jgi:hypothetical protein